jgi:hypothetical protein
MLISYHYINRIMTYQPRFLRPSSKKRFARKRDKKKAEDFKDNLNRSTTLKPEFIASFKEKS